MTGVKQLSVSEQFLQLDLQTRKCQVEETLQGCKQRKYFENVLSQCDCLPFSIKHLTTMQVPRMFMNVILQ